MALSFLDEKFAKLLPAPFAKDVVTIRGKDGKTFDSWERVRITKSMNTLSAGFEVSMSDKWRQSGERWPLKPGEPVTVYVGTNQVLTGYIDKLDVEVSNDDRSMTITGRDKTADLVDSSAYQTTNEFRKIKLEDLAKKFATELFNIKVITNADTGAPFERFSIKAGETIFELLDRAAKLRGVLLQSDEKGNLVITNRGGGNADIINSSSVLASAQSALKAAAIAELGKGVSIGADLVQGENILTAQASYNDTDRFATYIVKGQSQGTDLFNGPQVTKIEATAFDQAITRRRPLIIIAETSVDKKAAQRRANWEATVRAAKAIDVSITVQGWFRKDGKLWSVNDLVNVNAGFIGLSDQQKLLITTVTFTKDQSGTITELSLTRPDAFQLNPMQKTKDPKEKAGWKQLLLGSTPNDIGDL